MSRNLTDITAPKPGYIRFQLAKWTGDEAVLAAFSAPYDALAEVVKGKSVALVGNARTLADAAQGAQIDAADIVVRLNTAPGQEAISHGARTDWLFTSVRLPRDVLRDLDPAHVFWASGKRKRLDYGLVKRPGFVLTPASILADLIMVLDARPSAGMIATATLCALPFAQIRMHGFEFFSSLSLSGHRAEKNVPHDFDAERDLIMEMVQADKRLRIIRPRA
ncbi:glycosyltransferase family 29 protein [Thalassovita sp.]|uniref:glycosyltransferase family 29 protein n=1 Tax=Thalassovita sp. TaxID=1979401 RepID=UPI002B26B0B3|nr:glycosyltransferase family 29 protein [Thalassovita sp.]